MAMTPGSLLFVDTNILLIASDESRINHSSAKGIFNRLLKAGIHPAVNGQVIREYLTVATRPPNVNGLGMSVSAALHNISQFRKRVQMYEETVMTSEILQHLVLKHDLKGKRIHDANLAATMMTHHISGLLTENKSDFICFDEIESYTLSELNSFL